MKFGNYPKFMFLAIAVQEKFSMRTVRFHQTPRIFEFDVSQAELHGPGRGI